jgi:hypothetical protein
MLQSLVNAYVLPRSLILSTLMLEAIHSSQTSVRTIATRHHIPEDDILHSHGRENLKSYRRALLSDLSFEINVLLTVAMKIVF